MDKWARFEENCIWSKLTADKRPGKPPVVEKHAVPPSNPDPLLGIRLNLPDARSIANRKLLLASPFQIIHIDEYHLPCFLKHRTASDVLI